MNLLIIMATPNEIQNGQLLMVKSLFIPIEVLRHVMSTFDPSLFKLMAGEIVLRTPGIRSRVSVTDLIKYADNKVADIIVWATLSEESRELYISYSENAPLPAENIQVESTFSNLNKMGVIMMTYLLHGSLNGLASNPPIVPQFALQASGIALDQMSLERISGSASFKNAKFPGVVAGFTGLIRSIPKTMKSRVALSFAGNRVFSIMKMIRSVVTEQVASVDVAVLMMSDASINNAPYISFHPDHPLNPMENCIKKVLALLGTAWVASGQDLEALFAKNPQLYLAAIRSAMAVHPDDAQGSYPTLESWETAIDPQYSIKTLTAIDNEL